MYYSINPNKNISLIEKRNLVYMFYIYDPLYNDFLWYFTS